MGVGGPSVLIRSLLVLLALLMAPAMARAQQEVLPRTIIALYDGKQGAWSGSRLQALAQASLNRLGLKVEAVDVSTGNLPDLSSRGDVRGVLTWWTREPAANLDYWSWASRTLDLGKRFVVIGSPVSAGSSASAAQFWTRLGLDVLRGPSCQGFGFAVRTKASGIVEYERALPPYLRLECGYRVIKSNPENHTDVFLSAARGEAAPVDLVAATPRGAVAVEEALIYTSGAHWQLYLNLDAFFARGFDTAGMPIADIATRNGRRVAVAVVDAGASGDERVLEAADENRILIDLDQSFLSGFNGMRFGVTVQDDGKIAMACDSQKADDERLRAMFGRENVETGIRLKAVSRARGPASARKAGDQRDDTGCSRRMQVRPSAELVTASTGADAFLTGGQADQPRLVFDDPDGGGDVVSQTFDVVRVDAAWRSPLSQWAPVPTEAGGDVLLFQLLSAYGDGAPSPFAFLQFLDDVRRTDAPARRTPVGIALALDQMRYLPWRNGLRRFLQETEAGWASLSPMEFANLVSGFSSAEFSDDGNGHWTVANRGALQTIRFDDPRALGVDPVTSKGVIGWKLQDGSLLVWLDEAVEPAVIGVTPEPTMPSGSLLLEETAWRVWGMSSSGMEMSFLSQGPGEGRMVWRVPDGTCVPLSLITATDLGTGAKVALEAEAPEESHVTLSLPASRAGYRISVTAKPSVGSCSAERAL